jgi:hypothetical protein
MLSPDRCTKPPRCTNQATPTEVGCLICGKFYQFCADHGGEAAARRSLKSHMGLYHPKTYRGGRRG